MKRKRLISLILLISVLIILFSLYFAIPTFFVYLLEGYNNFIKADSLWIMIVLILYLYVYFIFTANRKYDVMFLVAGAELAVVFIILMLVYPERFLDLFNSFIIAELTLTLVWVEISKRPELMLLNWIPIIYREFTTGIIRSDSDGKIEEVSISWGIREATVEGYKFDLNASFSIDVSNIGYEDINIHEYRISIDDSKPQVISNRAKLSTQERVSINVQRLLIKNPGFHKLKITVFATTTKRSKNACFHISNSNERIRWVSMEPWKNLFYPLIKRKLKC